MLGRIAPLIVALFLAAHWGADAASAEEVGILGPQSRQAQGQKNVLIVVVRFPDATPSTPIEVLKKRVVFGLDSYVSEQSYGIASIKADFRAYVMLPKPVADYKVSPYNFRVDKTRVRRLIEDALTAIERDVDFSIYDHMLIIPAVRTTPGQGYGMICYCANPGMLSGVTKKHVPRYETLRSAGGKAFRGGVFVATENANVGMFAHDYFHALGGIYEGKRLVPCLYDYERQSDASAGLPAFDHHATYMGPWDIMSQHFAAQGQPPPGISSFTKIRLGWIGKGQVQIVRPGETAYAFLAPLSKGGERLVVKIPLSDGTYYLIENRQPIGFDKVLPDSGILILKVSPDADEGYGTVQVKSAGGPGDFAHATYKLQADKRNIFVDKASSGRFRRDNLAIVPLWQEGDAVGVLVTTAELGEAALKAGLAIQALLEQALSKADADRQAVVLAAIAAFKNQEFEKSYGIATATGTHPAR